MRMNLPIETVDTQPGLMAPLAFLGSSSPWNPFRHIAPSRAKWRCDAVSAPDLIIPGKPARGPNAARLARWLAADWHNPHQSQDQPSEFAHIHACFRPLPNSLLNGYAFYTESAYDYNIGLPYKTSVVLIVDPPDAENNPGALELVSFKIKDADEFWMGSHEPELLEDLTADRLIPLDCECNTVYVWMADFSPPQYIAFSRPGKGCRIRRGGTERETYLDSKISLFEDKYKPWDIGRDIETDARVWGSALGAFDFIPKTRFDSDISNNFES